MNYSDFVIRSYRKTPRTLSEAFNDAEYATAITRPKEGFWAWFSRF